jgi:hypothetical protein
VKYTLICDESSTEQRFMVIGSAIIPTHNHSILAEEIQAWKRERRLNLRSEFKWKKVSASYLEKYKELVTWFFEHLRANHFNFRAHVIDTGTALYRKYGNGDMEHAFYKVYYHLLYQAIKRLSIYEDGSRVMILLDDKTNTYPFRLQVLKNTLNSAIKRDLKIKDIISNVEFRKSSGDKIEPFIQIVDILIGAIAFVRNGLYAQRAISNSKKQLVNHIEALAGTRLSFDTAISAPFNIWTFDVEKSMRGREKHKKKPP